MGAPSGPSPILAQTGYVRNAGREGRTVVVGLCSIPGNIIYHIPGYIPSPNMPAPKLIIPTRQLNVMIPEDVMARLDLFLISGATGKVPKGAYQRFLVARITDFLDKVKAGAAVMPTSDLLLEVGTLPANPHSSENPE